MRPLIKPNTNVDNLTTYLHLELAKIKSNNDCLCFTTDKDLTANVVKSAIKYLTDNSRLANANPVSIAKGTQLFIPLAELPYTLSDTELTIQYALNSKGEYLQFISKSLFDGYVVRYLTVNLIDGSIRIKPSQPKPVTQTKVRQSEQQLRIALDWYEVQKKELNLGSIPEVTQYYKDNNKWELVHYWAEWSKIDPKLFPTNKFDRNFFSKYLNPYKYGGKE